jgi:putative ABC transport system permease protein
MRSLWRDDRREKELNEEVDSYLEMLVAEKIRAGMNVEQARRSARLEMGGKEQVKEACRDVRPAQWMEDLGRDLRYALRMLRKNLGFTVAVVLTLALGIGANTAMFTVVQGVLLKPLAYPEESRLVQFFQRLEQDPDTYGYFSSENFKDYRTQATAFERVACLDRFTEVSFNLTGRNRARRVVAIPVCAHFFELLGFSADLGRTFTEAEERSNAGAVVLSHRLWQEYFGGDPGAVGRNLILDGKPFAVIGVMPASFPNLVEGDTDLWIPQDLRLGERNSRGNDYLNVLGRLKDGITLEQAQAQLDVIGRNLAEQYPGTNKGRSVHLVPLRSRIVGNARPMLHVLMAAVGLVLLIACVNVANLFLIRGTGRAREFALCSALGARRLRVVRQLLTESFVVVVLGGSAGFLLAAVMVKVLLGLMPVALPPVDVVFLDSRVFLFCMGLIALTGVLFGLIPVRQSSRWSPDQVLRGGGRITGSDFRNSHTRKLLVAGQISLALCLLVGTVLLYASFGNLLRVDLGFQPNGVTTFQIHLPESRYALPEELIAFHRTLLERMETIPGVRAAGCTSRLPASGPYNTWGFDIEDQPRKGPGEPGPTANFRGIEGSYFQSLHMALRQGRLFDRHDEAATPPVALVSETFARKFWPSANPLGKRFTVVNKTWSVIGVVQDARIDLRQPASPTAYLPFSQYPRRRWAMTYTVRSDYEGSDLMDRVRRVLSAIDPDLIPYNVRSLSDVVSLGIAQLNFALRLMGAFAALALVLAGIGIYGVVSYSVASRVHEIGIRMAVGARPSDLLFLFLGHGFKLALAGTGIGLLIAHASTRILSGMLFGISATNPFAFAGAGLFLMAAALLACWIPARRAARIDPQVALRHD